MKNTQTMNKLTPVILCGGSGTRLWPMSRKDYPKQFLQLTNQHSLLEQTILRINEIIDYDHLISVCNEALYFQTHDHLQPHTDKPLSFILEPTGKNTAPAIALAALVALEKDPEATLLVLPADHLISDHKKLKQAIVLAQQAAAEGYLVTFGIKPSTPNTGYGYIKINPSDNQTCYDIIEFKEKPDLKTAEYFVKQGDFFWNSGMFLLRANDYLAELEKLAPTLFSSIKQIFQGKTNTNNLYRFNRGDFEQCSSNSIDYAIMEKTTKAKMAPLDVQWTDLGSWKAVAQSLPTDKNGNTIKGNVITQNTTNSFITSEAGLVATIGLDHHIVVNTKDAILIADKNHTENLKQLLEEITKNCDEHYTKQSAITQEPWGRQETLTKTAEFEITLMTIKPGASLSLTNEYHQQWTILQGTATIIDNNNTLKLSPTRSFDTKTQSVKQLANDTDQELLLFVVQFCVNLSLSTS